MRFRIDLLGATLLDITTGHDAHRLDADGPTGADSSHERRDSDDASWTHTPNPAPPTTGSAPGFRGVSA